MTLVCNRTLESGQCLREISTVNGFISKPAGSYLIIFSLRTGQTTVNKKAPIHYKWYGPQTPLKRFQKIPSNILWLNLHKIGGISILQSAHKQGTPSFHFHAPGSKRRYPCTQTASAVPKYFPPSAPVLYWLSHLTCISSLKANTAKKSRYNQHFFAIFRRILRNSPPTYLLSSDR